MENRPCLALTFVISALLWAGCATALYRGPERPRSQVAVLVSQDTVIQRVDSWRTGDSAAKEARYQVLPGDHKLEIRVEPTAGSPFARAQPARFVAVACVELEAGHTYRTEALLTGQRWGFRIVEVPSGRVLDPACDGEGDAPLNGAAVATGVVDREDPGHPLPGKPWYSRPSEPEVELADGRRPGSGISLFAGVGFGGDDYVKVSDGQGNERTLNSGDGELFGLGGMVTPLWTKDGFGVGLGVDVGVKYGSMDATNGSASITRFPVTLTGHMLANIGGRGPHYFLLKGGIVHDFATHYSLAGIGTLDVDVSSTWGPTVALGYYWDSAATVAWDVSLFAAFLDHVVGDKHIDAGSFGLSMALHLNM